MIDDPYRDVDLVELYDLDNPGGEDHAYYRVLADEIGARSIVDLGCGTGLLSRSLAGPGRIVIGVDASRTMLDYARSQSDSESVTWLQVMRLHSNRLGQPTSPSAPATRSCTSPRTSCPRL